VPDHAAVTLVVLSPDNSLKEEAATKSLSSKSRANTARQHDVQKRVDLLRPRIAHALQEDARRLLAWKRLTTKI